MHTHYCIPAALALSFCFNFGIHPLMLPTADCKSASGASLCESQWTMENPDSVTQNKIHFIFNGLTVNHLDVKDSKHMGFLEAGHAEFVALYVFLMRTSIAANSHYVHIALLSRIVEHLPKYF
eukprot:Plantae.Rhodophyta-Palmaria_palmata.ctg12456.p1 GENE.Plantae.Rhodophyta-Palmaria_palmata.ctg12456~~Plantae.Rhodophyta-Palmaria_palmata.ctg12456.p1  ORF type:complete len:123 (+),score=9.12 Plantae.Rhodophyta-Palmaria_palmata.ctg12456:437-805(+)